jgi:hypothetical protein
MRRMMATIVASLLMVLAATLGVRAAFQGATPVAPQLAGWLPQGALLTIESKDFAGLLKRWNNSPEQLAWIKSDNYSVFSHSRLFGRLGDAQNEFAQSAGLPPDMSFLNEVAGQESTFAWYDIGKLEFLYITHLPAGSADKTRLVQMRGKFHTRQIGNQNFYVRTQADQNQNGEAKTVAFATVGDWLLLATREDLMAEALTLMAAKSTNADSLAAEPWFVDGGAAAAKTSDDLRMTLNLEKIVSTPYFRSYWVQRNITELKQYRSAVADLYIDGGEFREERVLLPKSAQDDAGSTVDLAALTALLPHHAGVYRAVALPNVKTTLESIDEKLLARATGSFADSRIAPDADVAVHDAGSASDLETRIDAVPLQHPEQGADLAALRQALTAANVEGMMTMSRTGEAASGIWMPFQSAVVLVAAKEWDAAEMQGALQQGIAAHLTAGGLGFEWKPVKTETGSYVELSEARPLEMAVAGKFCLLTDDPGLMREMLGQLAKKAKGGTPDRKSTSGSDGSVRQSSATLIAGFEFQRERSSFARWSALVDRTNAAAAGDAGNDNANGHEPSFFSQNMRSLGDTFAALESEHVEERRDGVLTRQTVTYSWRR